MSSAAHFLSYAHHPLALGSEHEIVLPKLATLSERREGRVVRRLHELAD